MSDEELSDLLNEKKDLELKMLEASANKDYAGMVSYHRAYSDNFKAIMKANRSEYPIHTEELNVKK
jgi:hypothetical protein